MLKDNQLSTVLLLVALGFLIYYLTKPKTVSESFADDEIKSVIRQELSALPEIRPEIRPEFRPIMELQQDEIPRPVPESQSEMSLSEVQPEVLRQILAESEVKHESKPHTDTELEQPIFDFEANDTYDNGAELNSAFQRPIPPQARPDEVPINKNNLKKYDAKDFLPKEINSQWFDTDFSQAKYNVNDDKLINTERYVIGVNTVGQSLKNATYDIRGTVPNPKFTVSPWNNSTYEPDFNIRPLC
jgi:hypothetical protein